MLVVTMRIAPPSWAAWTIKITKPAMAKPVAMPWEIALPISIGNESSSLV